MLLLPFAEANWFRYGQIEWERVINATTANKFVVRFSFKVCFELVALREVEVEVNALPPTIATQTSRCHCTVSNDYESGTNMGHSRPHS